MIDAERDNLHAAVEWALASRNDLALALAAELRHYWVIRGYLRQGLDWLDQASYSRSLTRRPFGPRGLRERRCWRDSPVISRGRSRLPRKA